MSPRYVSVICAIAFIFTGVRAVKAQTYHQLNINDFQGAPQRSTGNLAYTNCMLDFSYQPVYTRGYYHLTFYINMKMDKDHSWLDKSRITSNDMLTEVLKHEQGHYIFAYLMQQELARILGGMRFGSNYEQQVSTVFTGIKKKYRQLNDDYDEDTSHMQNRKQQNAWDLYFKSQLGQYSNTAMVAER
ncbi:DUF922 domain-containing protein [Mucilaginibacter agri]|uniref:DUF922 domain-containing protein n=1 Tax=Mucilaginibacter agri TaxID=2695265 RepID=A0A965ZEQ5_9SPHI|nr:DUF922 domain-containing protein [Mucilaginibacter agri]NCD68624.1 DUF922 domain-containing protein [Mucilaginibacter agri]